MVEKEITKFEKEILLQQRIEQLETELKEFSDLQKKAYITFIYYIGAGVFLSKKVLANLITWDGTIHNTIDNVSGAKLGFALLWVIRYPVLLFKLGVMKVL